MHLLFHAGHHKTGTTTFQCVLSSLQAKLLEYGIYVPVVGGDANMGQSVLYPAQQGDWSQFDAVLDEAKAALQPEGVVLFSAEDLENCLVDTEFGSQFMHRARAKGVVSTRWVFVQRDEFEYFESLYGELSRHRQVLQYELMANEILERGFFSCATPQFRWYFDFSYEAALSRFRDRVCDRVSSFTFSEFIQDGIGSVIFGLFGRAEEYRALCSQVQIAPRNVRLMDDAVERNYVATFLGLGEAGLRSEALAMDVDALVARRLEMRPFEAGRQEAIRCRLRYRYGRMSMNWSARRIKAAAAINNAKTYLEIGVRDGETFLDVDIACKDGVDPAFAFETSLHATHRVRFFSQTSDEFWASRDLRTYDLVFIDGMHTFEQTIRDLISSMRFAHARTIWLIDDTLPCDVFSAIPDMELSFKERTKAGLSGLPWHGDVFKVVLAMHDFIPVLQYATIIGSGNPQTIAWYAPRTGFRPKWNSWEAISRLSFFDIEPSLELFCVMEEDAALATVRAALAVDIPDGGIPAMLKKVSGLFSGEGVGKESRPLFHQS